MPFCPICQVVGTAAVEVLFCGIIDIDASQLCGIAAGADSPYFVVLRAFFSHRGVGVSAIGTIVSSIGRTQYERAAGCLVDDVETCVGRADKCPERSVGVVARGGQRHVRRATFYVEGVGGFRGVVGLDGEEVPDGVVGIGRVLYGRVGLLCGCEGYFHVTRDRHVDGVVVVEARALVGLGQFRDDIADTYGFGGAEQLVVAFVHDDVGHVGRRQDAQGDVDNRAAVSNDVV